MTVKSADRRGVGTGVQLNAHTDAHTDARTPRVPAEHSSPRDRVEDVEVELLLEGVFRVSGYDFRDYAFPSVKRRVWQCVHAERLRTVSALQERVLHDPACLDRFLRAISVHVTAMFRDPGFYRAFRTKVAPTLRTYPFVRVWLAGCSTREEAYSMAILLREEGLLDRTRLYATDMSRAALEKAERGIYPLDSMREYAANYLAAGGTGDFADVYAARYGNAIMHASLRKSIVFAHHNLATDGSFNEFNVILCRNVLIYFNRTLQERVHRLLYESLASFGALGLGSKEALRYTPHEARYEDVDGAERLYRKVR